MPKGTEIRNTTFQTTHCNFQYPISHSWGSFFFTQSISPDVPLTLVARYKPGSSCHQVSVLPPASCHRPPIPYGYGLAPTNAFS
jgi:hypothetical protein